jgi:hypothetical protein
MDMQQGLICNITGQKADFEQSCANFKRDMSVAEKPIDDKESLMPNDVQNKLSADAYEKLKMEQRLLPGLIGGIVAGVVGAVLWAIITVSTGYQIGYMAVAIGCLVGFAVRYLGKGLDQIFGVSGAIIALLSCLVGNYLSIIGVVSKYLGVDFFQALSICSLDLVIEVMKESFQAVDILFYVLAVSAGYKFSFRRITERDIIEIKKTY